MQATTTFNLFGTPSTPSLWAYDNLTERSSINMVYITDSPLTYKALHLPEGANKSIVIPNLGDTLFLYSEFRQAFTLFST